MVLLLNDHKSSMTFHARVNPAIFGEKLITGSEAMAAWKNISLNQGLQETEYILDRVEMTPLAEYPEFNFMLQPISLSQAEFRDGLSRLAPWTYFVASGDVDNRRYATFNEATILFHRYRRHLIIEALIKGLGPSIGSMKSLDIGCNSGFFTLELASSGFKESLGIDFRRENIEQAEFLKHAFRVNAATFTLENAKDIALAGGCYDVVLNLGLMYHLSTPFEVMKTCFDVTTNVCVIDTITHKEPFSGYHLCVKNSAISIEGDLDFELQPTYRGIVDTIKASGFETVIEFSLPTSLIALYSDQSRRCFFAFKNDANEFVDRLAKHGQTIVL